MELIKNNKGGAKLCYQGHMYTKKKNCKSRFFMPPEILRVDFFYGLAKKGGFFNGGVFDDGFFFMIPLLTYTHNHSRVWVSLSSENNDIYCISWA